MSKYVIRPRFKLKSNIDKNAALDKLMSLSKKNGIITQLLSNRIKLSIPIDKQEYWSPILTINIEGLENSNKSELKCLIGPNENIWLMFVFIYGVSAMTFLFGGMMSLSELTLGIYSPMLLSIPISIILVLLTFIAAKIGQRKGYDQMMFLINYTFQALEISDSEKEKILF